MSSRPPSVRPDVACDVCMSDGRPVALRPSVRMSPVMCVCRMFVRPSVCVECRLTFGGSRVAVTVSSPSKCCVCTTERIRDMHASACEYAAPDQLPIPVASGLSLSSETLKPIWLKEDIRFSQILYNVITFHATV